jgi:hypothetical protein
MKSKETIEEVAKKYVEQITIAEFGKPHKAPHRIKSFIEGAKWQSKRMYSEEEVEKIISKLMNEVHSGDICYGDKIIDFKISPKKWFEQNKKK